MFKFFLMLGFASLYAASPLPSIRVEQPHSEVSNNPTKDKSLLTLFIDNDFESSFSLKMQFENNCSFAHLKLGTSVAVFPLTSIKLRINNPPSPYTKEVEVWESKGTDDCKNLTIEFTNLDDIKKNYEIELLGSWGQGGDKLLAGHYMETVHFTIEPSSL